MGLLKTFKKSDGHHDFPLGCDAWHFPGEYVLSDFPRKQSLTQGSSASFPLGTVFQRGRVKERACHRQRAVPGVSWILAISETVGGLTPGDSSKSWRKCIWVLLLGKGSGQQLSTGFYHH